LKVENFQGASLDILGASNLIEDRALRGHTLSCQASTGGLSKWPNYYPDVLHTYLGFCGLSIVGESELEPIDSRLCLPVKSLRNLPHYK
jgi:geranylgeranyl transferase type-1 subunit beta